MAVELLDDKKRWDQFVETSPQGLLFHKWDFLKTVERHSKYRFLPYCVYSGEELRCIFPFFVGRERGLTVMCSPPPNTQIWYLGFAFDPSVQALKAIAREKILDQVTDELCREIDTIGANFVHFTTVPNFIDVRFFTWKNFTAHFGFTSVIDLEKPLDEIWASFSRRCRQGIKHLSAFSPEIQQTSDVSPMLDIWRERFSELGIEVPLLSDSYLKELVATFPQDVTVYSVSIDGRLAAATACCVMQKQRYGYWIGNVNARKDMSVNDYLIWEIVKRAKSEGFKKLDLGGANQRLSRFKSKFDPVLEPWCIVERRDRLRKISDFTDNQLSAAKMLALHAVRRVHPRGPAPQ
jgi:lipid II:glycine glycyltransferase (peptidoglycan interpeptide bridge formation enzyme)